MPMVKAYLATTKPYYTLYYNLVIIIYFYLNQGNCKTQGTTETYQLSVRLRTKCSWVRIPLLSPKL